MKHYYNENNPEAAAWLKKLIALGAIPKGEVDERSIEDVTPADVAGFIQCHFFAGIGGWPLALAIAGVDPSERLWTGSCPCQPFSTAGEGDGLDDERHLWPAWHWLIAQSDVSELYGEQVASKAAEPWLDLVSADLEGLGFTFGALAFPAASVRAPHIRDRTYWMGYRSSARLEGLGRGHQTAQRYGGDALRSVATTSELGGLADIHGNGRASSSFARLPAGQSHFESRGDADVWSDPDWLYCRDGKWRPVERGTFPLVDGLPSRVGRGRRDVTARKLRLHGYGNAIVPQQAAQFILAAREGMQR